MGATLIDVITPGQLVLIGPANHRIEGRVICVQLTAPRRVKYQVAWWDGRLRRLEWLDAAEVDTRDAGGPAARIGFRQPEHERRAT